MRQNVRSGVLRNGESGHHREEALPLRGRQKSNGTTEAPGQADFFYFKEGEIHASGQRKDPSAEGVGTFLDRDRRVVPGAQCWGLLR